MTKDLREATGTQLADAVWGAAVGDPPAGRYRIVGKTSIPLS